MPAEAFEVLINRAISGADEIRSLAADDERIAAKAEDLQAAVREMADSLGECQMDVPFSPIRPVRRPDGTLRWCCNHDTEHCGAE